MYYITPFNELKYMNLFDTMIKIGGLQMSKDVFSTNFPYLHEWIQINPNLKDFSYVNNILYSPNGEAIDLQDFLVSTLLENSYFSHNKYTINADSFLNIIKMHVHAEEIINKDSLESNEYVKYVTINKEGYAVIVTSSEKYVIFNLKAQDVIAEYTLLIKPYTNFVPLKVLLQNLKGFTPQPNLFKIMNSSAPLDKKQQKLLNDFLEFLLTLLANQELLVGNAKKLLELFMLEINRLYAIEDSLNENQKYVLHCYEQYIKQADFLRQEEEQKEALSRKKASYGFGSLALILTSIIATGFILAYLLLFS